MAYKPLQGKVAIVTGCSSGIGLATTKLFLNSGALVLGVDISPFPNPSPFPSSIDPEHFHYHQANLLGPSASDNAVAACLAKFGPKIDILANVAGIMDTYQSADTVADDDWERVMAINSTVPVQMMRAVLGKGGMKERKSGSIVNVSSKSGTSGASAGIAYTASKHALIGSTKNVAWRFHDDGIRCNAVCPGGVATNINSAVTEDKLDFEAYEKMKAVHSLHMAHAADFSITPDNIAQSILFLASDASTGINGAILPIDKAWSTV